MQFRVMNLMRNKMPTSGALVMPADLNRVISRENRVGLPFG